MNPIEDMFKRDLERVAGGPVDRRVAGLAGVSAVRDAGSWLLGQIPLAGEFLSDLWADNLWADRIAPSLSDREKAEFLEVDRILFPDTASLLSAIRRARE